MDFLNTVPDDFGVVVFFYKDVKYFHPLKPNWEMAKRRTKSNVKWFVISCSSNDYLLLRNKYHIKSNSIIGFSPKQKNGKRNISLMLKKATVSDLQLFAETFNVDFKKSQNIRNKINSIL